MIFHLCSSRHGSTSFHTRRNCNVAVKFRFVFATLSYPTKLLVLKERYYYGANGLWDERNKYRLSCVSSLIFQRCTRDVRKNAWPNTLYVCEIVQNLERKDRNVSFAEIDRRIVNVVRRRYFLKRWQTVANSGKQCRFSDGTLREREKARITLVFLRWKFQRR